jgi:putative membrane protein insertion efficiency factor
VNERTPSIASRVIAGLIRLYQRLTGWTPPRCRFHPSCSQYGLEAVLEHGAVRGGWMAVRRVGRCHPWNDGGFDPVPPNTRSLKSAGLGGPAASAGSR